MPTLVENETNLSEADRIVHNLSESASCRQEDLRKSWKLIRELADEGVRMHSSEGGAEESLLEDAPAVTRATMDILRQIRTLLKDRQCPGLSALLLECVRVLAAKESNKSLMSY